MLTWLSQVHANLGRFRTTRRFLRALPLRSLGRSWLQRSVLRHEVSQPDDIAVVIGVCNRSDYRLTNLLRSIRAQTYPADSVRVILVDYGSGPASAQRTKRICDEHRAEYVRVDRVPVWSRSRCLNIGIRLADSKFLMICDVDIVLSPRYLSDAVRALTMSPLSVVCSPMLDLPEESAELMEQTANTGQDFQFDKWKQWCSTRHDWKFHPSIGMTYTVFYKAVRGYDEYYQEWGSEDDDLMRRFMYLGLEPKVLDSGSCYLHQWHPKYEGVLDGRNATQIQRNRLYFERNHSILRNDGGWGIPRA